MKDYKAYLFDWDGTLARTFELWFKALRIAYEAYDIHLTEREIAAGFGDYSHCIKMGVPAAEKSTFNEIVLKTAHKDGLLTPPLYNGSVDMLNRLKAQHKKLALITSSERQVIDIVLSHHELVDLFDLVISVNDVKAHKPDPEGLLFATEKFGVKLDEVVMIGDSDKDLGAAKNAKIDSILFYPKSHELVYDRTYLESFNPVAVVRDWNEFYAN
jgi:beta-phosphoglucomutase-like phosphatase (HAD superfamily)